jgi:hypothetical protein
VTDWIIDTNVVATANFEANHVGESCVQACSDFLEGLNQGDHRVVLDANGHMLKEYLGHRVVGQPPVGERFLRWLLQVRADPSYCEQVRITSAIDDDGNETFEEFPGAPEFLGFDADDRKFVAVSKAATSSATIVNATDPVWAEYADALAAEGVLVRCLCPEVVAC